MDHLDEPLEPELGPELMASLDTGRPLNPEVEERVVRALRERGALRPSVSTAVRAARWRRGAPWMVGTAAASMAFVVGLAAGNGQPGAERLPSSPGERTSVAGTVSAAAREYVAALSMVQPGDSAASATAMQTFKTAADQIVRLAPESTLSLAMQIVFPTSYALAPARAETSRPTPRVIWF